MPRDPRALGSAGSRATGFLEQLAAHFEAVRLVRLDVHDPCSYPDGAVIAW